MSTPTRALFGPPSWLIALATVMTESLSYLATAWALYGVMLALERPTVIRQLALLAAIGVAFLTRPQFGILYVTWVGGRKMVGEFRLHHHDDLTITLFRDRVVVQ